MTRAGPPGIGGSAERARVPPWALVSVATASGSSRYPSTIDRMHARTLPMHGRQHRTSSDLSSNSHSRHGRMSGSSLSIVPLVLWLRFSGWGLLAALPASTASAGTGVLLRRSPRRGLPAMWGACLPVPTRTVPSRTNKLGFNGPRNLRGFLERRIVQRHDTLTGFSWVSSSGEFLGAPFALEWD